MSGLRIFKIGGKVIDEADELKSFLHNFASVPGLKILVHGGGKWVSELSRKLGLEVNMINGRRVTDVPTLEVVKMILPGVANKNIIAGLQALGCNAAGFTGADLNLINAVKRPVKDGMDYGFVGDITRVNGEAISRLLGWPIVPVFTAMTHDGHGQLFNTNADTIASGIAVEMSKYYSVDLFYCFEKQGVLKNLEDSASLIGRITPENYQELKTSGAIHSGMVPKIENALKALNEGVRNVHICHYGDIGRIAGNLEFGTVISA